MNERLSYVKGKEETAANKVLYSLGHGSLSLQVLDLEMRIADTMAELAQTKASNASYEQRLALVDTNEAHLRERLMSETAARENEHRMAEQMQEVLVSFVRECCLRYHDALQENMRSLTDKQTVEREQSYEELKERHVVMERTLASSNEQHAM